jgi:hypothetical protein
LFGSVVAEVAGLGVNVLPLDELGLAEKKLEDAGAVVIGAWSADVCRIIEPNTLGFFGGEEGRGGSAG